MAVILLAIAFPSLALAEEPEWTGEWQKYWRGGSAILTLEQSGDRVTGRYEPGGGRLEGEIDGRNLRGEWSQRGDSTISHPALAAAWEGRN